ncbi:UNVERIFIED_CONTAM: hypothetical protein HDU68_012914 [Siphonaria sp. JEL0065]|nr:hypothetical protein HDU68_012914 [Siphonaria sp. JEL0065]
MATYTELHRALLADIVELRTQIIFKTDKLIDMLGGNLPAVPVAGYLNIMESTKPLKASKMAKVQKSHFDLGLRWEGDDYAAYGFTGKIGIQLQTVAITTRSKNFFS